jgi:apolipoprotein N-acyltransferase
LQKILFFINKLVVGIGDYARGHYYLRGKTPFGEFATVICYEIIFPGLIRKFYTNGGDFLVTITNDAWFGRTTGPYQHFSMAALRAVENRKPVIRAANTGISGFIDSNGKILSSTCLFERVVLTQDLKTDATRSFYSKYGDLFTYVWIVFLVILLTNLFGRARNKLGR